MKQLIVQLDAKILGRVQHWPGWLYAPMFFATTAGSPWCLSACAATVAYAAWLQPNRAVVVSVGIAFAAMVANSIIKHFIHRPRPDTLYVSKMWFATSSFPSGHAFGATVILGLLGYVAAQYLAAPWHYILPVASTLFIATIGVSRIYLGAHYPSDVLAGWLLGSGVLAIIIAVCFPL